MTALCGVDLDSISERSPEVILSFILRQLLLPLTVCQMRQLDLLPRGLRARRIRLPPLPFPSLPAESPTSRSGDPPLGPSESTLTYIPNNPLQPIRIVLGESRPGQWAWCPSGAAGSLQMPTRHPGWWKGCSPCENENTTGLEMESSGA